MHPLRRVILTVTTAAGLGGISSIYGNLLEPLLKPMVQPVRSSDAEVAEPAPEPPSSIMAGEFLPDVEDEDWIQNAAVRWRRGEQALILFNSNQLEAGSDGDRVRLEPFALIWKDVKRPERAPYKIFSEKARIQFESRISDAENPTAMLMDAKPGRIVASWLEGQTRIEGPDNVAIFGQNFDFSESGAYLKSDSPVTFAFGEHSGKSRRMNLELIRSATPDLGKDMPRISGIRVIHLYNKVELNLMLGGNTRIPGRQDSGRGSSEKPRLVRVTCDKLSFDTERTLATLEGHVVVNVPGGAAGRNDTLKCDQLLLQFAPVETPEEGSGGSEQVANRSDDRIRKVFSFTRLELESLTAFGRQTQARLISQASQLDANAGTIEYDLIERTVNLSDERSVVAKVGPNTLNCREIELIHDDSGNELLSLRCPQPGKLTMRSDRGDAPPAELYWQRSLHLHPDEISGQDVIEIDYVDEKERAGLPAVAQRRRALVAVPEQETKVEADGLLVRIVHVERTVLGESGQKRTAGSSNLVRSIEARGHVDLTHPRLKAHTPALHVDVFQQGGGKNSGNGLSSLGTRNSKRKGAEARKGDRSADEIPSDQAPLDVTARTIQVELVPVNRGRQLDVSKIVTEGDVHVTQDRANATGVVPAANREEGRLDIHSQNLTIESQEGHQVITLEGAPASIRQGSMQIEAARMELDRGANTVAIPVAGVMRLPVRNSLNGEMLNEAQVLEIRWQERMDFDGQTCSFLSGIVATAGQSLLRCVEMDVTLNGRIDLASNRPETRRLGIDRVECRRDVEFEAQTWKEGQLSGQQKGEFRKLVVEYEPGNFTAYGPGTVEQWELGGERHVQFGPTVSARANQPVNPKVEKWTYLKARFGGQLMGNYRSRTAQFKRQVSVLYGPVERAGDTFEMESLTDESGWLGCDVLDLSSPVERGQKTEQGRLEIAANGNCDLRSRQFRARSHTVTYKQESSLFTLRGQGNQRVLIYHQDQPGAPISPGDSQMVQFNPQTGVWTADGARAILGTLKARKSGSNGAGRAGK